MIGPFAVQADWIVPVESEPIPNGLLVVDDGIIQFVGTQLPSRFNSIRRFHLAGLAILPGLINSHCHLEFSDLNEPIPAGSSFPEWIGNLLAYRNSKKSDPEKLANERRSAINSGILESYAAGVRWIVDIVTSPWEPEWIDGAVITDALVNSLPAGLAPRVPISVQPCIELLDIVPQRLELALSLAQKQSVAPESKCIGRMGYSPHAPYTASSKVTRLGAQYSREEERLVSMHLAESIDEMEWIQGRKGAFADFLGPLISKDYFRDLGQISEHVKLLTEAWRAMIAHGNYLSNEDLIHLAVRRTHCGIVHCPRTHLFFGHRHGDSELYPLADRISKGVRHFLGTDSRASNPDLNIWSEAKRVRADHRAVSSIDIIKMITTDAAEFLCIQDRYGSIREGQPASLTVVTINHTNRGPGESICFDRVADVYEALLASDSVSMPLELAIASRRTQKQFDLYD
jgi:aminodeoxyfutalosine deaminase